MALGFFSLGPGTHMSGQIEVPGILGGSLVTPPLRNFFVVVMRKSDWQITAILLNLLLFFSFDNINFRQCNVLDLLNLIILNLKY